MSVIVIIGQDANAFTDLGITVNHHYGAPLVDEASLSRAISLSDRAPRKYTASKKPVLTFLHKSYASSNLQRDSKFFTEVLGGKRVGGSTGPNISTFTGAILSDDIVGVAVRVIRLSAVSISSHPTRA